MLAQKNAQPWSYMTAYVARAARGALKLISLRLAPSYGRTGGMHCSENKHLLQSILRDEWKFDGMIMSDW
jgi:beta-glucosidase